MPDDTRSPLDAPDATAVESLLADLLRPLMTYAELLGTSGHPAQSRLVWVLIEDLHRRLAALIEEVRRQAPDVALQAPRRLM